MIKRFLFGWKYFFTICWLLYEFFFIIRMEFFIVTFQTLFTIFLYYISMCVCVFVCVFNISLYSTHILSKKKSSPLDIFAFTCTCLRVSNLKNYNKYDSILTIQIDDLDRFLFFYTKKKSKIVHLEKKFFRHFKNFFVIINCAFNCINSVNLQP